METRLGQQVLVATFMGEDVKGECIIKVYDHLKCESNPNGELHIPMNYATSWDSQIPAWSKVMTLLKNYIKNGEVGNSIKSMTMTKMNTASWNAPEVKFCSLLEQYTNAVRADNRANGLYILVEAIEWYNSHPKNTSNGKA